MINFTYTPTDYVPVVDLDTLGKTFDTLEQGHQTAIKTAAELKSTVAQLDLNESEEPFRQELINGISKTVEDNSIYGNAYGALDDLVSLTGDITSNPDLIRKLKAQQDFKSFKTKVENDKSLPQRYKDYYLKTNPYYDPVRRDEDGNVMTDSNGNVIADSWQPIDSPTPTVDTGKLLERALQSVAKESGGGTALKYLDANGQITKDVRNAVTYLESNTMTWKKIDKEKLKSVYIGLVNDTPGAKESIEQDFKIAKYYKDADIKNSDGVDFTNAMDYNLNKSDGFFTGASYYNTMYSTEFNNALLKATNSALGNRSSGGAGISDVTLSDKLDKEKYVGDMEEWTDDAPVRATQAVEASRAKIAGYLPNVNTKNMTTDEILDAAKKANVSPEVQYAIRTELNEIFKNERYLNTLKEIAGEDTSNAIDTYNAILSFGDLPDNKYSKEVSKRINKIFDGHDTVGYKLSQREYNDFVKEIGGADEMAALGISSDKIDGEYFVSLSSDHYKSLYRFIDAQERSGDRSIAYGNGLINSSKRVGSAYEDWPVLQYEDGTPARDGHKLTAYVNDKLYDKYKSVVNSTVKVSPTVGWSYESPAVLYNRLYADMDPEHHAMYDANAKTAKQDAFTAARNVNLIGSRTYILGDDNVSRPANDKDLKKFQDWLRVSGVKDEQLSMELFNDTGELGAVIIIESPDGKESVTVKTNGIRGTLREAWENSTFAKVTTDMFHAAQSNVPLTILQPYTDGEDIALQFIGEGNYAVIRDDEVVNVIPQSDADVSTYELLSCKRSYDDLVNMALSGYSVSTNSIANACNRYAEQLAYSIAKPELQQAIYNNLAMRFAD